MQKRISKFSANSITPIIQPNNQIIAKIYPVGINTIILRIFVEKPRTAAGLTGKNSKNKKGEIRTERAYKK
jgi:hypothetical protein